MCVCCLCKKDARVISFATNSSGVITRCVIAFEYLSVKGCIVKFGPFEPFSQMSGADVFVFRACFSCGDK